MNFIVDFASVSEEFKELLKEYLKLFRWSSVQQWPLLFFINNSKTHGDTSWVNEIDQFFGSTISVNSFLIYSLVTHQLAFPETSKSLEAALKLFNNKNFHVVGKDAKHLKRILSNSSKIIPKVRATIVESSEVDFLTCVIERQKKSNAEMKAVMDANLKDFRESNSPSSSPFSLESLPS